METTKPRRLSVHQVNLTVLFSTASVCRVITCARLLSTLWFSYESHRSDQDIGLILSLSLFGSDSLPCAMARTSSRGVCIASFSPWERIAKRDLGEGEEKWRFVSLTHAERKRKKERNGKRKREEVMADLETSRGPIGTRFSQICSICPLVPRFFSRRRVPTRNYVECVSVGPPDLILPFSPLLSTSPHCWTVFN